MCILLLSVERLFHVYDGFVFPHESWWVKINKYFSDTGIGTKESHGFALRVFLETVHWKMSGFDIARAFDNVCNLYFQLKQKKYLPYTTHNRYAPFNCTDHLNRGLSQVLCV